jgi:hypothetical protein
MLLILVGASLGLSMAGLVLFAAVCGAIRNDDRKGLPAQAPSFTARLARWFVGLSGTGSARPRSSAGRSQLVGVGAGRHDGSSADGS